MENGQKTIRGLFDGSKIFNIPKYQRAYAWEKEHLEDFVDDIENQKKDKDYFFGTILFQEKKEMSDDFENIDIVDGQQRIEVYSKVVDEKKKRAYPIVSQKPKIPQAREKGHARERIYPI